MPSEKFECAITGFDAYHRRDPNLVVADGAEYPSELLYAERMTGRLKEFAPDANEVVQLAARCQHIGRWEISRAQYPPNKKGYLQWRNEEKLHHARIAEEILRGCGYGDDTIGKVRALLLKKELHSSPDTQLIEDVVCMVFLEFYLDDFASKHASEKVVDILRKTLKKMSIKGKRAVDGLPLSTNTRSLLQRAQANV